MAEQLALQIESLSICQSIGQVQERSRDKIRDGRVLRVICRKVETGGIC